MHEMSLARAIVDIVEREAAAASAERVIRIRVALGALSCASPDAIAFAFPALASGTRAESAELVIEPVDGVGLCGACGETVPMRTLADPCVACGAPGLAVISGDELRVLDMEVV